MIFEVHAVSPYRIEKKAVNFKYMDGIYQHPPSLLFPHHGINDPVVSSPNWTGEGRQDRAPDSDPLVSEEELQLDCQLLKPVATEDR